MLLQVIISGLTALSPFNRGPKNEVVTTVRVVRESAHVLLRSLAALWHEESASHVEAATSVLKAMTTQPAVLDRTPPR
jgi:hypothetical protein